MADETDWACPDCGRVFARAGQRHVCEVHTVAEHLAGKPAAVVELFELFSERVRRCGPVEFAPTRAQVGFRVRRIFAGVQLTATGLKGYIDLPRRVDIARFRAIEPYTKRLFVHSFTITGPEAFDAEFDGLLKETYAVGEGKHLLS
jgi:Domain of unknown function (DUF5655)